MADEEVRVRLVFEDVHILSKAQKKEGLSQSWILLKPQHHTISDVSSHIHLRFNLHRTCPHGLVLCMDGFVLPPFESTSILKDKDIVSVRKKGSDLSEIIKDYDEEGTAFLDKCGVFPGIKLLANEEFQKETGGYDSESEEDEPEQLEYMLSPETTPRGKNMSRKRKASKKSESSKKKKSKLTTNEECPKDAGDTVHVKKSRSTANGESPKDTDDLVRVKKSKGSHKSDAQNEKKRVKKEKSGMKRKSEKLSTLEADKEDDNTNRATVSKRSSQHQENEEGNEDVSQVLGGDKKFPSRSARRKKAKRQWLREKARMEKNEVHQKQVTGNTTQESSGNDDHKVSKEVQQPDQLKPVIVDDNPVEVGPGEASDDAGDVVVPVVIKPGHIRFEPFDQEGIDQAVQKNEVLVEPLHWNGITSKKKGQKWGMERSSYSKRNHRNHYEEYSEIPLIEEETHINDSLEYDKLAPYSGSPKEGDVIAYRLIELSSSWTPEISSYRVGMISRYSAASNKIMLVQVPEYPQEKVDEEDEELQSMSLYKEDGSLEIDFSSLLDVCLVKSGNCSTAKSVTDDTVELRSLDKDSNSPMPCNGNNNNNNVDVQAPKKADKHENTWDEISQALNAKKAELLQEEDCWSKKDSSRRNNGWSNKGLRGGALGPVMAYLRAQNEL